MSTPKLGLDELTASQSQPEVPINATFRALEQLVQLNVIARTATLPASPVEGDAYILTAPDGGGQNGDLAYYSGGWNFLSPGPGWLAYVTGEATRYQYGVGSPSGWEVFTASSSSSSGSSTDAYQSASPAAGVLDLSDATISTWLVELTGNVTSILLPSAAAGEALPLLILFRQDGTGGRTVAGWPTMTWEAGSAPTITSTANALTSVPVLVLGSGEIFGVS